ncbi:MAG: SDR family oxidoreductase [Treponema sp.]|jgi:NAD(P)-dependent dehydrogenase (short-subunit alcohol dehydrogenase family)|nr:SDR family oxidoreductase [Treponema sp.]
MGYMINLTGQTAIVTGGASGIGLKVAHFLASTGVQVVIGDLAAGFDVKRLLDGFKEYDGPTPMYVCRDISTEEECNALVADAMSSFGRVDILVNNAAVMVSDDWIEYFKTNTLSSYWMSVAVFNDMRKRRYGRIVNVSSSAVFSGGGGRVEYNATKGAMDSLTRYLAKLYASEGVTVNSVAAGPTLTPLMRKYHSEEDFREHYLPTMPINRLLTPEDAAGVVLFLCSPLSNTVCGEMILADGGRVRLNPA